MPPVLARVSSAAVLGFEGIGASEWNR